MATVNDTLIAAKYLENSQTTQYTAPATKSIIDKCVVTNTSSNVVTFTAHLVASGGAAGGSNKLISARPIPPGDSYICPEIVGQTLLQGGFISTLASAASSLVIMASGREITVV